LFLSGAGTRVFMPQRSSVQDLVKLSFPVCKDPRASHNRASRDNEVVQSFQRRVFRLITKDAFETGVVDYRATRDEV
jgi:hypothetical protein